MPADSAPDGYECPACGEVSDDPDTAHDGRTNELCVTCSHCGTTDRIPQDTTPPRDPPHLS